MSEQDPAFRKTGVDYANFPVDSAYISRADVIGAYAQGRKDAEAVCQGRAATFERKITEQNGEIERLRALIDTYQQDAQNDMISRITGIPMQELLFES